MHHIRSLLVPDYPLSKAKELTEEEKEKIKTPPFSNFGMKCKEILEYILQHCDVKNEDWLGRHTNSTSQRKLAYFETSELHLLYKFASEKTQVMPIETYRVFAQDYNSGLKLFLSTIELLCTPETMRTISQFHAIANMWTHSIMHQYLTPAAYVYGEREDIGVPDSEEDWLTNSELAERVAQREAAEQREKDELAAAEQERKETLAREIQELQRIGREGSVRIEAQKIHKQETRDKVLERLRESIKKEKERQSMLEERDAEQTRRRLALQALVAKRKSSGASASTRKTRRRSSSGSRKGSPKRRRTSHSRSSG
jgi:hypothetical protein